MREGSKMDIKYDMVKKYQGFNGCPINYILEQPPIGTIFKVSKVEVDEKERVVRVKLSME